MKTAPSPIDRIAELESEKAALVRALERNERDTARLAAKARANHAEMEAKNHELLCRVQLQTGRGDAEVESLRRKVDDLETKGRLQTALTRMYFEHNKQLVAARDTTLGEANTYLLRAREAERVNKGLRWHLNECEQIAAKALSYMRFMDDQEVFPGTTEKDGYFIGEHIYDSIVEELATKYQQALEHAVLLEQALEPMWQRAMAPGTDAVPGDGTVTVFMQDCRNARALVKGY